MITDTTREKWRSRCETIFDAVNDGVLHLDSWESEFFENVYDLVICKKHDLSMRQSMHLGKIYGRVE